MEEMQSDLNYKITILDAKWNITLCLCVCVGGEGYKGGPGSQLVNLL